MGEDVFATGGLNDSLHRNLGLRLRLNLDFTVDNQIDLHEMRVSVSRGVARVLDFLANLFHESLDAHVSHGVRSTKVFGHFDVEGNREFFHCEVSIPRAEKLVNNFVEVFSRIFIRPFSLRPALKISMFHVEQVQEKSAAFRQRFELERVEFSEPRRRAWTLQSLAQSQLRLGPCVQE